MNGNTEFKAVPSDKKLASSGLAYFCTGLYFFVAVLVGITIWGIIKTFTGDTLNDGLFIVGLAIVSIIGVVIILRLIDLNHYWFLNEKLQFKDDTLIFTYDEVISVLGHTKIKDRVIHLSSYKVTNKKIILYGEIEHYEPMSKSKIISKVDIPKYFENQEELLKRLDDYIKRG